MNGKYLTRAEATAYLLDKGVPVKKTTLQSHAVKGEGPLYKLFGNKALYLSPDLDDWVSEKLAADSLVPRGAAVRLTRDAA